MTPTRNNDHSARLIIDPDAIASHLESLSETPLCDSCHTAIVPVAGDAVALLIEVIRLHGALTALRLESANRLAAIRAALHAHAEGESDPLAYLLDELPADSDGGWCR